MNESEDYYVTAFSAQFLYCNFGADRLAIEVRRPRFSIASVHNYANCCFRALRFARSVFPAASPHLMLLSEDPQTSQHRLLQRWHAT